MKTQLYRFARLFAVTFVTTLAAAGVDHLTASLAVSTAVGALEVAYRQVWPAPAPKAPPAP